MIRESGESPELSRSSIPAKIFIKFRQVSLGADPMSNLIHNSSRQRDVGCPPKADLTNSLEAWEIFL